MDYLTALNTGVIKSGCIAGFYQPRNIWDQIIQFFTGGKYYHLGMIYIDPVTKDVKLYEANYDNGTELVEFGGGFLPFDIIDVGLDFTPDVKAYADSLLGNPYSWVNLFLVAIGINNSVFGYICSTYIADILAKAGINFDLDGLTPNLLISDLINVKKGVVTNISSFGPPS